MRIPFWIRIKNALYHRQLRKARAVAAADRGNGCAWFIVRHMRRCAKSPLDPIHRGRLSALGGHAYVDDGVYTAENVRISARPAYPIEDL